MPSESTVTLLERARQGDTGARGVLYRRFLPRLQRWAHGRLPARGREALDTDDLVQVTLLRALEHAGDFEPRHEGAFLAYLRCILVNQIRDQLRRVSRRPERQGLDEHIPDRRPSPVEEAIGFETLARYERSLTELTPEQRVAVILRVELGYTYEEMAAALGRPSGNAARMLVTRALVRLARGMLDAG